MIELFVTIDAEPDCDVHWNRSEPLTFSSVTDGIPRLLRPIWDRHGIAPIYFVSPEVVMHDDCVAVLKEEIRKGAVIGTHLHSEYIEPHRTIEDPSGRKSDEFPCYAHDTETEFRKIENFTRLIEERLSYRPLWYRAARYGADLDTVKSLAKLGYKYDSSLTPGISWESLGGPDHRKAPLQPYWISREDLYTGAGEQESIGIREYPITICGKRFGLLGRLMPDSWLFYRWLRPTHMTVFEQKGLIQQFVRDFKNPALVMMFHSMEIMVNATPFVRNRFMQRRFLRNMEETIEYAVRLQHTDG